GVPRDAHARAVEARRHPRHSGTHDDRRLRHADRVARRQPPRPATARAGGSGMRRARRPGVTPATIRDVGSGATIPDFPRWPQRRGFTRRPEGDAAGSPPDSLADPVYSGSQTSCASCPKILISRSPWLGWIESWLDRSWASAPVRMARAASWINSA